MDNLLKRKLEELAPEVDVEADLLLVGRARQQARRRGLVFYSAVLAAIAVAATMAVLANHDPDETASSSTSASDVDADVRPTPGDLSAGPAESPIAAVGPIVLDSNTDIFDAAQPGALVHGEFIRQGRCLYIETEVEGEAERLDIIIWPAGTTWNDSTTGVELPDGVFVPVGEELIANEARTTSGGNDGFAEISGACGATITAAALYSAQSTEAPDLDVDQANSKEPPATPSRQVVVPDLVGLDLIDAIGLLLAAGLDPYAIDAELGTGDTSVVVSIGDSVGRTLHLGSTLELHVSRQLKPARGSNDDRMSGILNGRQSTQFDTATEATLFVFLDPDLTYFDTREISLHFEPDDLKCASLADVGPTTDLRPGLAVEFTLIHNPADDLASMAPASARGGDLVLDC